MIKNIDYKNLIDEYRCYNNNVNCFFFFFMINISSSRTFYLKNNILNINV